MLGITEIATMTSTTGLADPNPFNFGNAIVYSAVAFVVFSLLRRLTRKTGLDNVPGPVSPSWISGMSLNEFMSHVLIIV